MHRDNKHRRWGRVGVAALILALWAGLAAARPVAAQEVTLGWGTVFLHTTGHGGSYDLTSGPAPTVRSTTPLTGGVYALTGDTVGRTAQAAIAIQADLLPAGQCDGAPNGAGVELCVEVDNVGAAVLTHHRVIAPDLGVDRVVEALSQVGVPLRLTLPNVPTPPDDAVITLEVISSSGPLAEGEAPGVVFPAFATAVVAIDLPTADVPTVQPLGPLRVFLPALAQP